jgi:hypothetical protein
LTPFQKYYPNLKIAMLTAFDFPEYRQAAEQDAERFFVKDSLDWKEVKEFVQSLPKNDRLRKGSIGGGMRNGQEDFYS